MKKNKKSSSFLFTFIFFSSMIYENIISSGFMNKYKGYIKMFDTNQILNLYCNKCFSIDKISKLLNLSKQQIKNILYVNNIIKKSNSLGIEEFIRRSKEIHGENTYDYSKVVYPKNNHKKVVLICKKCGTEFEQSVSMHLKGYGCKCQKVYFSKGEFQIKEWLDKYKMRYELQKRFDNCKDILTLPFDFYLPDYDVCIEYQGQQHYVPNHYIKYLYSEQKANKAFELQQKHDKIKEEYCKNNNLYLIQIAYDEIIDKTLNSEYIIFNKRYNKKDIEIPEQKLPHFAGFFKRCSVETTKTRICEICGKEFEPKILSNGECSPITVCSRECAEKLRKKRSLAKWGYESANQSPEVKAKQKATNLKRYGVENSGGSKKAQEKARQTNLERHGVENGAQSMEARQKISQAVTKYVFTPEIDELLTRMYIEDNLSIKEMANHLNISQARIVRRVSELNLHRSGSKLIAQSKIKYHVTKEELEELYIKQKLSYKEIMLKLNLSEGTLSRKLKEFGFKRKR